MSEEMSKLTDEQIQEVVTAAVRERRLSWLGFKIDDQGAYSVPVLSPSNFQFARAIEAAPTDPLLQRIAEFVAALDEEMVVSHLGVFNPGDDPKKAIKDLMLWSQGLGEYFAGEKAKERIAELERQLEEARKDAEPIRRMKQRADELIAAFENAPDGKALDMQKGQS